MSVVSFHFAAIPRQYWEDLNPGRLGFLAAEALSTERRLDKEINLASEGVRYAQLCRRLVDEAFLLSKVQWSNDLSQLRSTLQASKCGLMAMDPSYLEIVWSALLNPVWERFGRSFFTPDQVKAHRHAFVLWARQHSLDDHPAVIARTTFLDAVDSFDAGLVEIQLHSMSGKLSASFAPWKPLAQLPVEQVTLDAADVGAVSGGNSGKFTAQLRSQFTDALRNGSPVCFGNQAPHDVITECFHEFVYAKNQANARCCVRVTYADGSEAEPFPVLCLPKATEPVGSKIVRVALLSMRHLSLDTEIDFCWFRNREVSRSWALAEADAFCYQETRRQLCENAQATPLHMILFHTGFEPACIGFYRGLVDYISERRQRGERPNISVEPRFYRGSRYETGSFWA